jgi:hypothetical protein
MKFKGRQASIKRQDGKCRGSASSGTWDILATSDIDPVDVTLCEAVVPRPSKRQWILRLSQETRDYMLRFVTVAISVNGGMTDTTKQVIANEFLIEPALVDVITSWVMSREFDDKDLPDDQKIAVPPDSWLHHVQRLAPDSTFGAELWRDYDRASLNWSSNNRALGPSQGAAYDAELEELYQHRIALPCQTVTMGDRHPTMTHMESKKGG